MNVVIVCAGYEDVWKCRCGVSVWLCVCHTDSTAHVNNAKKSFYRSFNSIFGKVGRSAFEHVMVELLKTKCVPVLWYGLEVCSPSKAQISSMDYDISSCYRKIFNVKSDENVRFCMVMFNSVDVDTMLMKRRQKFFDGYKHLDNLLCQITMSCNCN